jgi:serine/threonine-protein kinase
VGDVQELLKRRVPQIVLAAVAGAWVFLQLMDMFVDRETLPRIAWQLSLPFAGCGVAASAVIAWFHGERGEQEASKVEYVLLGVIAVIWVAISAWIVLGG